MYLYNDCMKKTLLITICTALLFSSCATLLNPRYQKITLETKPGETVLINQDTAKIKDGKYLIERDLEPKQITIQSEGNRDVNFVTMQHRKSPLHILSWIPFGILIYPPFFDKGSTSWNYDKEYSFNRTPGLSQKKDTFKNIHVNKVSFDIGKNALKSKFFMTYKQFLRRGQTKDSYSLNETEDIQFENSIFSSTLNSLLQDKGYIDTTKSLFKSSYLDNLLINASIEDITLNYVANIGLNYTDQMIFINLAIKWEVLDYYKSVIYSTTTTNTSGQFARIDEGKSTNSEVNAMKDVIEAGLIEFLQTKEVEELLIRTDELKEEQEIEELVITNSVDYVNSLSKSTTSALTIKSDEGFGSGFIIGQDGYIITNYHVVSNADSLTVILNDMTEHPAEVVRVSKIYDLALIKIDHSNLIPYEIQLSKEVDLASECYAIGTPSAEDLSQTISRGIVSGFRNNGTTKLIQTDASINSGNSGGPLINKNGVVIGVVASKLKGFGVEGVAFGIPAYEIFNALKITIQ